MIEIRRGNVALVSTDTGEVLAEVEPGSKLSDPEDREAAKEYIEGIKAAKVRNDAVHYQSKLHGGFTFLSINRMPDTLTPATVGRLVYLSTYVGYDNQLLSNKRTPITKTMLPEILCVGKTVAKRFFSECEAAKLLREDQQKRLYISDAFFRGSIGNRKDQHTRLWHDTIRDLYKRLPAKHHKYFGYVVQMLPWVNVNYNIVCSNPMETDPEQINPIDIDDLYMLCGYEAGSRNTHRFIDALTGAWFDYRGSQQALCALFVRRGPDGKHTGLVVNPHLMYMGDDIERVGAMGCLFNPKIADSAS